MALAELNSSARIVAALEINHLARQVYEANLPHSTVGVNFEFLPLQDLRNWQADVWWASPPCQPFTVRGKQRDLDDPRARPFLRLIEAVQAVRPTYLALENVPGFRGSGVHQRLLETLDDAGYAHRLEVLLCPSTLGQPNRRQRYYLLAGREPLLPLERRPKAMTPLASCIDATPSDATLSSETVRELTVDKDLLTRYAGALHIVDADDPEAETLCFTSAYGRSPVRSGSYLRQGGVVRRFAPHEILRILGFPSAFRIPADLSRRKAWQLAGNSLSLPAAQTILRSIPDLA